VPGQLRSLKFGLSMFAILAATSIAEAGMPSLLPTSWTSSDTQVGSPPSASGSSATPARLQAISFFAACLAGSAWGVRRLWNSLRNDFPRLPKLSYGRSLSLVTLWGLMFVVVLTMISGARELMTPGAWRKQGWTYQLADKPASPEAPGPRDQRRQALEKLRTGLWQYAATHAGSFPDSTDPVLSADLWQIPGWPALKYLIARDRTASDDPRLLAFEPSLDGDPRLALMTNGEIRELTTAEIRQQLSEGQSP